MKKSDKTIVSREGTKKSTDYVVNFISKIESLLHKTFIKKSRNIFHKSKTEEETLKKYKPPIFVETFFDKKQKIHEYLTNLGYRLEKSFIGHNYLYLFDEKK